MALGGRRSGKTTGSLAPKIIIMLLLFPGCVGGVLSPTYRQAKNVRRALISLCPQGWISQILIAENRIKFVNGAEVALLSADRVDSARSEGVAWFALDERQDIPEEAAANAFLSTSEGGGFQQLFETGTVKQELREHYDVLMASEKSAVYRMRSRGNPFIDHSLFDDAEELLDRAMIQRELEAEWPDLEGRVYYPFETRHIQRYPMGGVADITAEFLHSFFDSPVSGSQRTKYIIGIDPPRHAVLIKIYAGEIAHVVDEIVIGAVGSKPGDIRDLAKACKDRTDGHAVVIMDPHESHWDNDVRKYFKREGFRLAHIKQMQQEYRVTSVRSRIEKDKFFVDPRCVHLIESLREQVYVNHLPDKHTKSRISKLITLDHIVDAMGYPIYKLWPAKINYAALEEKKAA